MMPLTRRRLSSLLPSPSEEDDEAGNNVVNLLCVCWSFEVGVGGEVGGGGGGANRWLEEAARRVEEWEMGKVRNEGDETRTQ